MQCASVAVNRKPLESDDILDIVILKLMFHLCLVRMMNANAIQFLFENIELI